MKIYFYKNASFKPTDVAIYDCNGVVEFFDTNHINPDEYVICDKHGNEHKYDYDLKDDIYIIFPKIAKGSKGKGWLGVVLGIVTIFTAGATAGLLGLTLNGARMLGIGMLLSGAGTLIMGQQKLPSMDINSDSATKQNYQWNVGNLSTNRGVKGVTFGSDVVPEGELLAYRTYGTSSISGGTSTTRYYYGKKEISREQYKANKAADRNSVFNYLSRAETTHTDAYANDDGVSWLEMLIGCGEGELDSITDIKVNDTPIENIININDESTGKCITRLGSNNQTSIPSTDLDRQVGIMSVGQVMPQKLAGSDNPLVITTSHACDSALIACQTNVLYNMDTQSGAKNRCYLKPKIGYRLSGSSDAYTYVNTGIGEIDNDLPLKAESAFYFNVAINFPSNGIYEISLQNCSAEKCVQKGLLGSLPTVLPDRLQCAISIDNIALYDNIEQTFPGTALIYLRLPASQALSGSMPKVTWKQSRNNTYVWNGTSYVAKPLDNLAWAIYDILAQVKKDNNTYHNEGEDVHNIDYDKFSDFADFCNGLNIKGNWFLNKLDTAWSTAMSVATSARAFIGTRNGKIAPFWDCATEMTQIFTVGNYESLSGAVNAKKDRARAIEATFNDEDDNYISKTIRVEVDDFAADADAVGVTYVGLTNVDAVYKAAHYQLRKNKYLCQTVKFTANLDALVCELNDVIGVQCDITKYGVGGRIFAVNGNQISLDAPVTLNGGNYALLVAHDNGTVERMQVVEHSGTLTTVTISGYTRAPKANEVYSFGVVNNEVKKYRVTSIVKTSDLKCEIEAVEYQPQVYVEGTAPDISYTNPNANISNIAVTYNPEGVDIAWHKDVNTAYVDVYVDGVYYGRFAEGATIPNVNSTQQIECVPVNAYGEEGTSVVRAISNSIPAPSQPPIPIVQALPTGVVAQFQIPQNQYITWIIIKEGDNELGRSIVAGDEVTLNLNLEGGTHHLTAYFLNSYGKTSTGRDFDATPFGIDSNMLSNGFLMKPQGSILRLSAKGCDSTSIKSTNGVKDVSGYNHHGQAFGGVSVLDGGEGFGFESGGYIDLPASKINSAFNNLNAITFHLIVSDWSSTNVTVLEFLNSGYTSHIIQLSSVYGINVGGRRKAGDNYESHQMGIPLDSQRHTIDVVFDYQNAKVYVYIDAEKKMESTFQTAGQFTFGVSDTKIARGGGYNGTIKDFRIYPRALSATEVKSMYMLPDEAVFGQINADLIGANQINAVHLNAGSVTANAVASNEIIANGANIKDGVITNAKIANLDAAKITSGTIAAARIGAGSISASKLNVSGYPYAKSCSCLFKAQGVTDVANGAYVGDSSGHGKYGQMYNIAKINNLTSSYYMRGEAFVFNGTSSYIQTVANIKPSSTNDLSFYFKIRPRGNSHAYQFIFDSAGGGNRIGFGYTNTLKWYMSTSTGDHISTASLSLNTDYTVCITLTGSGCFAYVNGVQVLNFACSYRTLTTAIVIGARNSIQADTYGFEGYMTEFGVFEENWNDDTRILLQVYGADTDSGTITADRIATDAITSRTVAGGGNAAFTTNGMRINLAGNGYISAKNFYIDNSGNAVFKGTLTAGKIGTAEVNKTYNSLLGDTVTAQIGYINTTGGLSTAIYAKNQGKSSTPSYTGAIYAESTGPARAIEVISSGDEAIGVDIGVLNGARALNITTNSSTTGEGIVVFHNSKSYAGVGIDNRSGVTTTNSVGLSLKSSSNSNSYSLYIASGKATSSGGWSTTSDRNKKAKFKSVDVLNRLKSMDIPSWKFNRDAFDMQEYNASINEYSEKCLLWEKSDKAGNPPTPPLKPKGNKGTTNEPLHIGVMAQDFNKTFGCNFGSDEEINYTDTIGVCMRAIQELSAQLDSSIREIRTLKRILRANGTITDEIIAEDRDNEAIRRLTIAKARQAKREEQNENTDTLDNNTNDDGLR